MQTCKTCRWWKPEKSGVAFHGHCVRFPPSGHIKTVTHRVGVYPPDTNVITSWPLTHYSEVCGEHTPTEQASE